MDHPVQHFDEPNIGKVPGKSNENVSVSNHTPNFFLVYLRRS
jgi:hypothetical protein